MHRSRALILLSALLVPAVAATACGPGTPRRGAETPDATAGRPAAVPVVPPVVGATRPAAPPTATPTGASTPVPAAAPARVRGVWVHLFDDTLKTPGSIDRMLDRVAASGANTVVAEVVRRQDAYYRSDVLPETTDPAVPDGFDPLAHLVEGAHRRDLRLHAWVPLMPAHHRVYGDLPTPEDWVWSRHGPGAPPGQRWVTRHADGTWGRYLDPGHPAVRDHLVSVVTEIAADYAVDAVHLDYLRYPARDTGYNPAALARFRAETGRRGTPSPGDPAFAEWRRRQTRTLLRAIRASVTEHAPGVGISAAVIAQRRGPHAGHPFTATPAHRAYFQDWPRWVAEGLLDAAMPMMYFRQHRHGRWFAQWADFARAVAADTEALVAPGVAGYLNTPAAARRQLRRAADGTDGVVLYSYQQTVAEPPHDRLLDNLPTDLWQQPARPPELADPDRP